MKNIFVIILFFALQSIPASSADNEPEKPLAAYKLDGLWHFIDYKGKEIFPPIALEEALGYSDGMFCVSRKTDKDQKWGYMNLKGEFVIEPYYDKASLFDSGYAVGIEINHRNKNPMLCFIIDKQGQRINREDLLDASVFSEGLSYIITAKRLSGYIDESGDVAIDLGKKFGNNFSEGLAAVSDEDINYGYIDKKGKLIINHRYDFAKSFSEGLAAVSYNTKYGYIDKNDSFRVEPIHDYAREFKEGRAFVGYLYPATMKIKWGIVDMDGNFIVDYIYTEASDYSEGLASVRDSLGWGFIDLDGNYVIEHKYYHAGSFVDGLAWVSDKEENISGFIDIKGEFIIKIEKFDKLIDLRLNKRMF